MSIPNICHQVWLGGDIPEQYMAWHKEAKAMNPSIEFWLWRETGVENTLGINIARIRKDFPGWAGVSNVVRLHIMHVYGGFYFDLDYRPIKPLDYFLYHKEAVCLQQDGRACNSYFQCMPQNDWTGWQIKNLHLIKGQAAFAGVDHMTRALQEAPVTILPTRLCYPWNFDTPENEKVLHEDTIMCHEWHASWLPKNS